MLNNEVTVELNVNVILHIPKKENSEVVQVKILHDSFICTFNRELLYVWDDAALIAEAVLEQAPVDVQATIKRALAVKGSEQHLRLFATDQYEKGQRKPGLKQSRLSTSPDFKRLTARRGCSL